jgi:hypothetical protein
MNDIKINVKISIPGRTLYAEKDCYKITKRKLENTKGKVYFAKAPLYDYTKNIKNTLDIDTNRGVETIAFFTRRAIPAYQSINMTRSAYDYFIEETAPKGFTKTSLWKKMSKEERIKYHLAILAESIGGQLESFKVFDD